MKTFIDIFIIMWICVYVIDLSGIIDEIEKFIKKLFNMTFNFYIPKPFSCSLCMTWWISIIYLIITNHFTLPWIGCAALLSYSTSLVNDLINAIFEKIRTIIFKINKK